MTRPIRAASIRAVMVHYGYLDSRKTAVCSRMASTNMHANSAGTFVL